MDKISSMLQLIFSLYLCCLKLKLYGAFLIDNEFIDFFLLSEEFLMRF